MKHTKKHFFMGLLLAALGMMTSQAWAERLFATTNVGGGAPSDLLELNPTTGALISTIGSVGYGVNGLTYDATTGTLYATTSAGDPLFPSGLLTINSATGAGTPIGAGGVGVALGDATTALLTANSAGQLYSWLESNEDDLVLWNKAAGTASVVGDSGLNTGGHSLSFDNSGILYLVQSSDVYQINTATGGSTLLGAIDGGAGTPTGTEHHGDFNPVSNLLYAIDALGGGGGARNLYLINAATQTLVSTLPTVNGVHALAFLPSAATGTAIPAMSKTNLAILALLLALGVMTFARRRFS